MLYGLRTHNNKQSHQGRTYKGHLDVLQFRPGVRTVGRAKPSKDNAQTFD